VGPGAGPEEAGGTALFGAGFTALATLVGRLVRPGITPGQAEGPTDRIDFSFLALEQLTLLLALEIYDVIAHVRSFRLMG